MAWWIMRLSRKQEVPGFNPTVGKNCEAKLVVEMALTRGHIAKVKVTVHIWKVKVIVYAKQNHVSRQ